MGISITGVTDPYKLLTYIRAAADLGFIHQLKHALKELIQLDEKEFYKEIVSLVQTASEPLQHQYQVEVKPRVLSALRQVVTRFEWNSTIETHPYCNMRRGILGEIENRCPIETSRVSDFETT